MHAFLNTAHPKLLAETFHGLLCLLDLQNPTGAVGKEHRNLVLARKLSVNLLILTTLVAARQELSDVLLVAHTRGEEGEKDRQHKCQRDCQPASFSQKIIYP